MSPRDPLDLELIHPGEPDPEAVDGLLDAIAELLVDSWLARRAAGDDVAA